MKLLAATFILCLGACGTYSPSYERESWATMGYEEARAKCEYENNTIAGLGASIPQCLAAKGWRRTN